MRNSQRLIIAVKITVHNNYANPRIHLEVVRYHLDVLLDFLGLVNLFDLLYLLSLL